jgi:hypothetical protein
LNTGNNVTIRARGRRMGHIYWVCAQARGARPVELKMNCLWRFSSAIRWILDVCRVSGNHSSLTGSGWSLCCHLGT